MLNRRKLDQLVAICWDNHRFHFLIATVTDDETQILAAESTRWSDEFSAKELADSVQAALKQLRIRQPKVVIGIARSQADLFEFDAPAASDDVLPAMVRNLVCREFTDVTDDDVVDFAIVSEDESTYQIHAAVMRREVRQRIDDLSNEVGVKPSNIVLRPFSVASLLKRIVAIDSNCLVINRLDESADLILVVGDKTVLTRSIRIDSSQQPTALIHQMSEEVMRTIAAAPHADDRSEPVEHIYVFGFPQQDSAFLEGLADDVSLAVSLLNPFEGIRCKITETDSTCPYAALVGMIRDFPKREAVIDFINPKKAPDPPNRKAKLAFYAITISILLFLTGWFLTDNTRQLKSANDSLDSNIDAEIAQYRKLQSQSRIVGEVDRWRSDEVNWLDELRDLTRRFPNNQDAVVGRLSFDRNRATLSVRVRDPSVKSAMESALRDLPYRSFSMKRISQASESSPHPWQFEATLVVRPRRPKEQYRKAWNEEVVQVANSEGAAP